jgi:hypothetical protein
VKRSWEWALPDKEEIMMNAREPSTIRNPEARHWVVQPWVVACIMLALIVLFFVLREHWDHVAGKWPYLLLLACPFMHLFMHGGHGHAGHHDAGSAKGDADPHSGRP